jgi:magnesium transporter
MSTDAGNTDAPAGMRVLALGLFELDAVAACRRLERLDDDDAVAVLTALPHEVTVRAFGHLHSPQAAALLRDAPPALFRALAEHMEPQQAADVLLRLASEDRERLIENLPERQRRLVQELLTYPAESAGRAMTTDFLAFHTDLRAADAIERMRDLAHRNALSSYTYVVDGEDRLVGVINIRDLMLAPPHAPLGSIMRPDVFTVDSFADLEVVAHELSERKYFAVPVVDAERRLLGVVKSDRLLSQAQQEATEDIQKMFGAGGDERVFSSVRFSLRKRLPWLHVNLATAFLAAAVVGLFEDVIATVTVLAVYLPVVAGQGGNAGAQSLAVVMRGIVMREIPARKTWTLLRKETLVGLCNGIIVGAVTAAAAWLWNGNPYLGVVIGLAMIATLLVAGFSGAAIPLAMRAVGLDPAQSSSIVLTTVTDVVGFSAFLGFASLFMSRLA